MRDISELSINSFSVPSRAGAFLSLDRAKTWKGISINKETNTFSVSDDVINNPDIVLVVIAYDPNPPWAYGVAFWAPNPSDYVLGFADSDGSAPQTAPTAATSNITTNTKKGVFSKIFGK